MEPTSTSLDRRYSDEKAEAVTWTEAEARLAGAEVAWIVTVRRDGRPHATPMVPVVLDGKVYFHTGDTEVKYANIQANPQVMVLAGDTAWERGLDVAIEGTAVAVTDEALLRRLVELYRRRWDGRWQLAVKDGALAPKNPGTEPVVFEVTPSAGHGNAKGDPFGHTTYRF
ncbi:pyridoxamine 5'-phosphate oxidase family protein [Plantactinospora sonchi]|uniref:Pyridoxamine 5'-phosphate oxidase family protein n=1 Tax=Plantactinospora sonchi TaxID=1544735 RepID=A0ABU7RPN7_9ACTN